MFNNLDKFSEAILHFLTLCFQVGVFVVLVSVGFTVCKSIDFIINFIRSVMI